MRNPIAPFLIAAAILGADTADASETACNAKLNKFHSAPIYDTLKEPCRKKLVKAMQFFCAVAYKSGPCILHLGNCGKPCMRYVPSENADKVLADQKAFLAKLDDAKDDAADTPRKAGRKEKYAADLLISTALALRTTAVLRPKSAEKYYAMMPQTKLSADDGFRQGRAAL